MKLFIASFFLTLFMIVLTAPTVISMVDDTQEISIFLDLNEEEESNEGEEGKEAKKNTELKLFAAAQRSTSGLGKIQEKRNIRFRSKYYFSEYSKIDTPPPKTTLIS